MSYCSIHNHTEYSNIRLLDSINKVSSLFDRAIEIGLKGFAITDHECLSAHVQAVQKRKELVKAGKINEDFKLILGDEIYLIDDIEDYKENYTAATHSYYHFIVLAKDPIGYEALKEISSTAWNNSYTQRGMERVPIEKRQLAAIMKDYKGHVIASTACLGGELAKFIVKLDEAERKEDVEKSYFYKQKINDFIDFCEDTFGKDDFYLEMQPSTTKEQIIVNKRIISISGFYGLKVIYSTDSHYESKERRLIHKSYLNAMDGEREVDDFYSFTYMMSIEEVYDLMKEYIPKNIFDIFTDNTLELMSKCENYDLFQPQIIPEVHVVPENFIKGKLNKEYLDKMNESEYEQDRYWVNYCVWSLKNKGLYNDSYLDRLNIEAKEMWLISEKLGVRMTSYYNTMQKIIEIVWDKGDSLVGPARGSATGFLSCYLLGITQMDPMKWNLPHWRHLTETRPELPDIDFDTQASRRKKILNAVREFFNKDMNSNDRNYKFKDCWNVLNIATFGTEGPKSACLTACRGYRSEEYPDGIDSDVAQFLTAMIPAERGFTWPLKDCLYGNEEKGRKPIKQFGNEIAKYPNLLEIMLSIEGIVNKRSSHASGVYIYNTGFLKHNAMMRTPKGVEITQFNMSDSDYMGSLKYDFLTVEALDKLRTCMDLLLEDGEIEYEGSLKKTYDKYLHPDVLDYDNPEIWKLMGSGEVINLFQFDTAVGSQCAKKLKPHSLVDAASANSLMRLMAEQGAEQPMDRYLRMKNNIQLWYQEMKRVGLTAEEVKILEPHYLPVYGTPNTQEDMMETLMNPKITNFDLTLANKARKIVAKKKMKEVAGFEELFYQKGEETGARKIFLTYVWNTCIKPQLGYSFSRNHTTPYTAIALQELNLYYKYPSIYWNTACLTVNAGSAEADEDETQKATDYAKMAIAIGDIQSRGVKISLVDINRSSFGFKPDIENNQIIFGLKGVNGISDDDLVNEIIKNRPYISIEDLLTKVKLNKKAVLNLIKAGAFDNLYKDKTRTDIMIDFIHMVSNEKKRLTLQNFNGLIEANLIPEDLSFVVRVYKYTKILKKYFKDGDDFILNNEQTLSFFEENFDTSLLDTKNGNYVINQKVYDKVIYQKQMDIARAWLKAHHDEVLKTYNDMLFKEEWNKYCGDGNISGWEMDSVSFYYHDHELKNVNRGLYGISNFSELPENPAVDYVFTKAGKEIPIYKLTHIIGTVISKNKTKGTINLLTTDGVVLVRFRKEMFAAFDKQLSEKREDGTKKIVEKSWFNKGNKLMITGFRREDQFVPKRYSKTPGHTLYEIQKVNKDGTIELRSERDNAGEV